MKVFHLKVNTLQQLQHHSHIIGRTMLRLQQRDLPGFRQGIQSTTGSDPISDEGLKCRLHRMALILQFWEAHNLHQSRKMPGCILAPTEHHQA